MLIPTANYLSNSKNVHTEQDFKDDLICIKEFTTAFESKIRPLIDLCVGTTDLLNNMIELHYCLPCFIGYGAETVYYNAAKSDNTKELIWISTEINPNGINQNHFGRIYIIKYQQYSEYKILKRFYDFSISKYHDVLEKFDSFIKCYAY